MKKMHSVSHPVSYLCLPQLVCVYTTRGLDHLPVAQLWSFT